MGDLAPLVIDTSSDRLTKNQVDAILKTSSEIISIQGLCPAAPTFLEPSKISTIENAPKEVNKKSDKLDKHQLRAILKTSREIVFQGLSAPDHQALLNNNKSKPGVTKYKCYKYKCQAVFESLDELKNHWTSHNDVSEKSKDKSERIDEKNKPRVDKPESNFQAKNGKKCLSDKDLALETESITPLEKPSQTIQIESCDISQVKEDIVEANKEEAGNPLQTCDICHKSFKYLKCLKDHMLKEACGISKVTTQNCVVCHKSFKQLKSLKAHMLAGSCDISERELYNRVKENTPQTNSGGRSGLRTFDQACHICHKSFKYNGALKGHLLTHGIDPCSSDTKASPKEALGAFATSQRSHVQDSPLGTFE